MKAKQRGSAGLGLLGVLFIVVVIVFLGTWFGFMKYIVAENGQEVVLVDSPYFFGREGVREQVIKPGHREHVWRTTKGISVTVTPQTISMKFDDLSTKDGTFLDFDTSIQVQVINSQRLIASKGVKWFENSLQKPWTSTFRDLVKTYSVDELLTKPEIMADMEAKLLKTLNDRAVSDQLDIKISDFNMGQGRPNKVVIAQMDESSREVQAAVTYAKAKIAQDARKASEIARGDADIAYANKMNYSPEQVVQMAAIKAYSEACNRDGAKCVIMAPGTNPVIGLSK